MRKIVIMIGLILVFVVMTVPAFSQSLRFDFDGDEIWDNDWGMEVGDTVEVDVWLDDYTDAPINLIIYKFTWTPIPDLEVIDAWPNDTDHGGEWDPSYSYSHIPVSGHPDDYWYRVASGNSSAPGIPVSDKIKLHTIVLEKVSENDSEILTFNPGFFEITVEGGGKVGVEHTSAVIHPPIDCDLTIIPETENVFTWETVQFSTTVSGLCFDYDPDPSCYTWEISVKETAGSTIDGTGLYTAGGNEGTDIIRVTDTCNNNIFNTAVVNVAMSPTTTTTSVIPPPPPVTTTTTSVIPEGGACITDKSCNDGVFCNGEERCVYRGEEKVVFSWSSSLAGSTGDAGDTGNTANELGICRRGEIPCPDDGLYCTGEESCDEENQVCLSTGDPCEPEGLVCDEEDNICRPGCVDDDDCEDDGLFCNGEEICINGSCGHSGDPCPDGTTCVEETDQCTTSVPRVITATPDPIMRSRWILFPAIITIVGEDTSFSQGTSQVSYDPKNALLPMPAVILGPELIWQLVFVNPPWLAGKPDHPQTVTVTVDDVEDEFEIELLPFILDHQKQRP